MEYLKIEIFRTGTQHYSYIIWNGKSVLFRIEEDEIMDLLDEAQISDFYLDKARTFLITEEKIINFKKNKENGED